MHKIPTILTERVDDIPLLLAQMQRMSLPTLLDTHFPTHGNWQGLSLGWVSTIWLSSILSRGDHRMVHVEPWVAQRLWTLRTTTGQTVTRVDFTDDRLYLPCTARVQASVGRGGLLYVGDCKMASRETRARIAAPGDFYLCPLPQVQLAEGELDAALEAVWSDAHPLHSVVREGPKG